MSQIVLGKKAETKNKQSGKNTQALEDTLKQLKCYLETILARIDKVVNEKLSNLNDDDDGHNEEKYYEENINAVNNNLKKP